MDEIGVEDGTFVAVVLGHWAVDLTLKERSWMDRRTSRPFSFRLNRWKSVLNQFRWTTMVSVEVNTPMVFRAAETLIDVRDLMVKVVGRTLEMGVHSNYWLHIVVAFLVAIAWDLSGVVLLKLWYPWVENVDNLKRERDKCLNPRALAIDLPIFEGYGE